MPVKVLCVDDDPNILSLFQALFPRQPELRGRVHVETEQDPAQALAAVAERGPYAVVLSDMQMPGMDGIRLLSGVRQLAPDTVRMVLTGHADFQVAIDAVNEGHIFRFLTKPCPASAIVKAVKAGVEQYRLVTAEKELLEKTLAGSIHALTELLGLADPDGFGHAARVRRLAQQVGAALQVENPWHLDVTAMLSQVGCVTVPDHVLRKVREGADLTPGEAQFFESHPEVGRRLIAAIPRLEQVAEAVAYQEKRFDGGGPPAGGSSGAAIPLAARVLKVVLDFDNLESRGATRAQAVGALRARTGWYDPAVLEALTAVVAAETPVELMEVPVGHLLDKFNSLLEAAERGRAEGARAPEPVSPMVLAADVRNEWGALLLRRGQEVTRSLLQRLKNSGVREPIRVFVSVRGKPGGADGAAR